MIKRKILSLDYILIALVFTLVVFGIITIGSATKINIYSTSAEFKGQIIWFVSGVFLMIAAALIDYRSIAKFYILIYFLNLALLILVLLIGTGDSVSRWVFGIQPSEFSKIFMIIFIAKYIDNNEECTQYSIKLLMLFISTFLVVLLIQKQPSLSASLVTIVILIFQIFAGGLDSKIIKKILIITIPIIIILVLDLISEKHFILSKILNEYQIDRITSALSFDLTTTDPSSYQTKNSVWAIGSGKLLGKGIYNGTVNQLSYLPESHNDFIFAVIGEEFGFIGCLFVLSLMLAIISRALYISIKSVDKLGMLIVVGIIGMFSFQMFINVGVATGLLPNTGMPFPFLSYGGSSMWVNMIAIGLILNVGSIKQKKLFKG